MTSIIAHSLAGPPRFEPIAPVDLSDRCLKEVEKVWTESCQTAPHLHDDPIFMAHWSEPPLFRVSFESYKLVIAMRRIPGLAQELGIRPLAVTGILTCADGIVFGRRSMNVSQGPGLWDLAPSGGLTVRTDGLPDPIGQIRSEMVEETGISEAEILDPVGWIEDRDAGVICFIVPLRCPYTIAEIRSFPRSEEYSELIASPNPRQFVESNPDVISDVSVVVKAFL